ncbi:MAG: hypothetical protein WCH11_07275, partial [Bdellovibrio sp.]
MNIHDHAKGPQMLKRISVEQTATSNLRALLLTGLTSLSVGSVANAISEGGTNSPSSKLSPKASKRCANLEHYRRLNDNSSTQLSTDVNFRARSLEHYRRLNDLDLKKELDFRDSVLAQRLTPREKYLFKDALNHSVIRVKDLRRYDWDLGIVLWDSMDYQLKQWLIFLTQASQQMLSPEQIKLKLFEFVAIRFHILYSDKITSTIQQILQNPKYKDFFLIQNSGTKHLDSLQWAPQISENTKASVRSMIADDVHREILSIWITQGETWITQGETFSGQLENDGIWPAHRSHNLSVNNFEIVSGALDQFDHVQWIINNDTIQLVRDAPSIGRIADVRFLYSAIRLINSIPILRDTFRTLLEETFDDHIKNIRFLDQDEFPRKFTKNGKDFVIIDNSILVIERGISRSRKYGYGMVSYKAEDDPGSNLISTVDFLKGRNTFKKQIEYRFIHRNIIRKRFLIGLTVKAPKHWKGHLFLQLHLHHQPRVSWPRGFPFYVENLGSEEPDSRKWSANDVREYLDFAFEESLFPNEPARREEFRQKKLLEGNPNYLTNPFKVPGSPDQETAAVAHAWLIA